MCLSVPALVVSVNGDVAEVSVGGALFRAGLQMVENVSPGDYVLLHAGFAIQKISEDEAMSTLKLLRELDDVSGQ
ncbi:MAG TPA: HypC/HybG/HupF family hydrogenase formation chaperone [Bacteroidales bacterium]|jgi:hydrogenase expression/formation protein HypC|nr:HypC/HybG/HupF family hydrogenase formation chaperone [Bacteroidales bacterium]HNR43254.1 HypC/HybG/HupF family hydrogenase formation chaperone [Bacteroidales bacterium]